MANDIYRAFGRWLTTPRGGRCGRLVLASILQRLDLQGEREVVRLRRQIELLGPYQVAMERIVERMADMEVPQFIGGNGGDTAEQLLSVMPLTQAQGMLRILLDKYADPSPDTDIPVGAEAEANVPAVEQS